VAVFTKQQVAESMIHVQATMGSDGVPVIQVEDKPVELSGLLGALRQRVNSSGKTTLLLEHDNNVSQDVVVKVIDAAKGAGMDRVRLVVP
jgi:biopolymer transport protein ExbD